MERSVAAARGWLLGRNTVVRLGLVILFVGLPFLVRYAAAAGLFPIEFRLAAVAVVGVGMLGSAFGPEPRGLDSGSPCRAPGSRSST